MNPAAGLALLLRASLEGGALVLLVAALTRLGHRLPAWSRALLWWAACLKLVIACLALPAVPLPMPAPAAIAQRRLAPAARSVARWESRADDAVHGAARAAHGAAAPRPLDGLATGLFALWVVGAAWRGASTLRESRHLERAWRNAAPWHAGAHTAWLADSLGTLAPHCELRTGDAFTTPLVLAGPRGRILVPASFEALPAADQRAALAHEVAHLKRGDLAWGAIVALAETLFWFHPLARWAAHEYALAREEACDADAMRLSGAEPHHYGELLLAFGLEDCSPRHAGASYGSRHFRHLRRRLVMLGSASRPTRTQAVLAAVAIAAVLGALVPYRLVSAHPDRTPVAPAAPAILVPAGRYSIRTPAAPEATPSTTTETIVNPGDNGPTNRELRQFSFGVLDGDQSFLYGSFDRDLQADVHATQARAHGAETLWLRIHDRTYTSTDTGLLREVSELLEPLTRMSSSQSEVGSTQGEIGEQQGRIGEQQGEMAEKQSRIESAIDQLEQSLEDEHPSGQKVHEVAAQIAKLKAEIAAIEAANEALEAQSSELERAQDSLGVVQDKLQSRWDEASATVLQQIRKLAEEAIADGRAVRQR